VVRPPGPAFDVSSLASTIADSGRRRIATVNRISSASADKDHVPAPEISPAGSGRGPSAYALLLSPVNDPMPSEMATRFPLARRPQPRRDSQRFTITRNATRLAVRVVVVIG
jgi:hypothetical protein